jgi:prepilin-type N-terminal cleavage/methylation domain-containing protein
MFKMKNLKKGFTLIELLVVIAIIGILSSVVLASLNSARGKGNDAKTKATLAGARAAAEVFYDTAQTYTNVCTSNTVPMNSYNSNGAASYPGAAAPTCREAAGGGAYAMSALLIGEGGTNSWCIDSVGHSNKISAPLGVGITVCPAS